MRLTLQEIIQATNGKLLSGTDHFVVKKISTDTRRLLPGDFYIALEGPHFDGHDFLDEAFLKGASGALVSSAPTLRAVSSKPCILVKDTLKSLGDMAHAWRQKFNIPVIAITGSSGKTTTKDMLALCLETQGPVCKTEGNLNNLVGLPLTMFTLEAHHLYAVWEMGMNQFGEIARLTDLAQPTVGLITNVGLAHLEKLGGIEGVAKAKSELFKGLSEETTAVVNLDDPYIINMPTKARRLSFGFSKTAQICALKTTTDPEGRGQHILIQTPKGNFTFWIPVHGKPGALDFLAAYSICFHLKIDEEKIKKTIRQFKPGHQRGEEMMLKGNIRLINDAYNANPSSLAVVVEAFARRFSFKRKMVVLGEMLELGDWSQSLHEKAGQMMGHHGINLLVAYGPHAGDAVSGFKATNKQGSAKAFDDLEPLNAYLEKAIQPGDAVLVKGSRGMHMERVVEFLKGIF